MNKSYSISTLTFDSVIFGFYFNYMKSMILLYSLVIFLLFLCSCKDDTVTPTQPPPPPSGVSFIDYQPTWSPDGHTIAYFHLDTSNATTGIFLIDTNGTNKRLLIANSARSPDFSPDGNWITFHTGDIFKIKINSDSLFQLTNDGSNYYPSWSPDGKWIAYSDPFVGSYNIWKIKFDGSNNIGILFDAEMPCWSPDGRKLVVQKYVSGITFPELYTIDTNNQNLIRITFNINNDMFPRFSPDGQKIIFTQQHEASLNFQLYTININGTGLTKITDTQGYTADYSPDGERIVYCDSSPSSGRLWIMNKDGTNKKQLTFP